MIRERACKEMIGTCYQGGEGSCEKINSATRAAAVAGRHRVGNHEIQAQDLYQKSDVHGVQI